MLLFTKRSFFIVLFSITCNSRLCIATAPDTNNQHTDNNNKHVTIFAHGLGGCAQNGNNQYMPLVGGPIIGKNGPEWNDAHQTSLGQNEDIDIVVNQIRKHAQKNITLLGLSKGAAVMLNTVGMLTQKDSLLLKNIKAVIVDSPFASPETVAQNIISSKFSPCCQRTLNATLETSTMRFLTKKTIESIYPCYDSAGITPIKSVKELWKSVDRDMVVIFIHSQEDTLIHVNDSRMLYMELKKLGFNNLYFIETTQGAHGHAHWGTETHTVLRALMLIYLKHNLPLPGYKSKAFKDIYTEYKKHEEHTATLFSELSAVQPSIENVCERINSEKNSCCMS